MCLTALDQKRLRLVTRLVWEGMDPWKANRIARKAYPPKKRKVQHRDVTPNP